MGPKILDSHIHLWPSTATTPKDHPWMTPGHPLAKQQGIRDYLSKTPSPTPFVYIETDRYLPNYAPAIPPSYVQRIQNGDPAALQMATQLIDAWAHQKYQELRYLRRIVEGRPDAGDGFEKDDGNLMKGIVGWAPFHIAPPLFDIFMNGAKTVAGGETWRKVVGFRYLLQGIKDEAEMRKVALSESWICNIVALGKGRGGKGWTFDIGVDAHSGGAWQLDVAADLVDEVRRREGDGKNGRVKFILNHLCKPDLSTPNAPSQSAWLSPMKRLAAQPDVYMKFSGAFNEFGEKAPQQVPKLLERLSFYTETTFQLFGPEKIMFASDWPVCNVGGPEGEDSWGVWKEVIEGVLSNQGVSEGGREKVWWATAAEAYGVEV